MGQIDSRATKQILSFKVRVKDRHGALLRRELRLEPKLSARWIRRRGVFIQKYSNRRAKAQGLHSYTVRKNRLGLSRTWPPAAMA